MNSEQDKIRSIIFPLIHGKKVAEGMEFKSLLGTGFLIERNDIGMTTSDAVKNVDPEDVYCIFVVNGKWEWRSIRNLRYHPNLNIAAFSVINPPYKSWISISKEEYFSSKNFVTFCYPDEYLNETDPLSRPDLAYHQGYIIRRLTDIPTLFQGDKLFELSLSSLSKGCYGAPLLSVIADKCSLIGIYVGDRKFFINAEYEAIIKLIDSSDSDNFWQKLKSEKSRWGILEIVKRLGEAIGIAGFPGTGFILSEIIRTNDKSDSLLIDQTIKDNVRFKKIFQQMYNRIPEKIHIEYGLAVRATAFEEWVN